MTINEYLEANRRRWNEVAAIHAASDFYNLDRLRSGGSSLHRLEIEEVGEVTGKTLLHLQCHIGTESVSWARLGARVTGVDFAEKALQEARRLATDCDVDARFVQANIYDLPETLADTFDVVFTSWGVLGWLPDIAGWARVVGRFLAPGGVFYVAEGHPFGWVFDDHSQRLEVRYPYFWGDDPIREEMVGTYADPTAEVANRVEYNWGFSLGEVVSSLIDAGLRIQFVHEFPRVPWQMLPILVLDEGGDEPGRWYRMPPGTPALPLSFSIRAIKE